MQKITYVAEIEGPTASGKYFIDWVTSGDKTKYQDNGVLHHKIFTDKKKADTFHLSLINQL